MRVRVLAAAAVLAASAAAPAAWPSAAGAAQSVTQTDPPDAVLVSDDDTVTLKYDNDKVTASVGIINNADKELTVEALPETEGQKCSPTLDPVTIPANHQKSMSLEFKNCPKDSNEAKSFKIVEHDTQAELFSLKTKPPASPDVNWKLLWWFPGVGGVALILLFITFAAWKYLVVKQKPDPKDPTKKIPAARPTLRAGLSELGSSWTFKESWASNATVVAAAFTAVFGATDVAKTVLGETDSKTVLAIVAVASATALGLAGTAPLVLQAFRHWNSKADVTPIGIILAGAVTLAATGGALGITVSAVTATDVGNHDWLRLLGWVGGGFLVLYAFTATIQNFQAGLKSEEKKPVTFEDVLKTIREWLAQKDAVETYTLAKAEYEQAQTEYKQAQAEYAAKKKKYDNLTEDARKQKKEPQPPVKVDLEPPVFEFEPGLVPEFVSQSPAPERSAIL